MESHFLQSIRDNQRFQRSRNIKILGIRYIDDLRIVIVCLAIPEEIAKSKELIELFIKSLPHSLLLEPEENYNNTFRFLEGYQFYNNPTIKSAFVAKNYDLNESQLEYTLTAGFPFQTYLGSYSDNPPKKWKITYIQDYAQ